jgi:CCR4-NOT transcription complex subunit 2
MPAEEQMLMTASELYSTLVTPWADPLTVHPAARFEEAYGLPAFYNVHAPAVQTKLGVFTEDTLFYAFYSSPKDTLQLDVAEEMWVCCSFQRKKMC